MKRTKQKLKRNMEPDKINYLKNHKTHLTQSKDHISSFVRFILLLSLLSLSCTDKIYELASVEGIWSLTGYNVEEAFDINNDGIKSINLLEEIECANNEILIFE